MLSSRRTYAPALIAALALLALAPPAAVAAPAPTPLSAQPGGYDFGLVDVDWGEQNTSIWIQNASPDPVTVDAATLDGAAAFRIAGDGCNGQMLASGQGCNVGVGFDPSDGDSVAATLHVPVAGAADLDVTLNGSGGVRRVTIAPETLDFGAVAVGESTTSSFTLSNSGNLPFQSIVAIPSSGDVGAFRVVQDGCSLHEIGAGQECKVSVRFTPLAAGTATAMLLLIGGNSEPAIVTLRGNGLPAPAPSAPAASVATAAAAQPDVARIAFDAFGLPARVTHGRIDLGGVRCVEAERCTVTVRPRVYAIGSDQASVASVRSDVVLWSLRRDARHATLALPAGLRGTPALLVARLRVRTAGHAVGTRTIVVPLVQASSAAVGAARRAARRAALSRSRR